MCRQKANTSSNYCDIHPYDNNVSVFVKYDTIFRLFFWNYHKFKFRKVVQQHTEGMMGSITWLLLEIYLAFQQWKNFENPLTIDKVIAMSLV